MIRIRVAEADEIGSLCDRIAELDLWKQLGIPGKDLRAACSRDPDRHILVGDVDGQIAGCIMFRLKDGVAFLCERVFRSGMIYPSGQEQSISPQELPDGAYVNMLAVFEEFQGRGVGAELLSAAEATCAGISPRIYLCVSQINPRGLRFYERQGYVFVAEARDCIRPDNTEHLMEKLL